MNPKLPPFHLKFCSSLIFIFILKVSAHICHDTIFSSSSPSSKLIQVVNVISRELKGCEVFHVNVNNDHNIKPEIENEPATFIQSSNSHSAGVFAIDLIEINENNTNVFMRFSDVHKHTIVCGLGLFVFQEGFTDDRTFSKLFQLFTPRYAPMLRKDEDHFIFFTPGQSIAAKALLSSDFGAKIKHKLALFQSIGQVVGETVQIYGGANGQPVRRTLFKIGNNDNTQISLALPDLFEGCGKTFNGHTFKMSIPKVAFRFEVTWREAGGIPRRGYYKWWLDAAQVKFNFTCFLLESSHGGGTGKILSNGSWRGAVSDILDGSADWAFVIGHILSRHKYVEWSAPLSYELMVFLTHKPRTFLSPKAIFWPFTTFMWAMFFVTLVTIPLLLKLIATRYKHKWSYYSMLEYAFATFLEQDHPGPYRIPIDSVRILGAFWLLFAMIISVAYRGKLVSLLAFPIKSWVPTTFEELANSHFGVGLNVVGKGGAAYSILSSSPSPVYTKLFERMELHPNADECLVKAANSDMCCITWEGVAHYISARNLSDRNGNTPLQRSFETTSFIADGLVWEKRAIFRKYLDQSIWSAIEMGLVPRWFELDQRFLKHERWEVEEKKRRLGISKSTNDHFVTTYESQKGPEKLKVSHFKGVFGILLGGLCIAAMYFLFELVFHASRFLLLQTMYLRLQ